MRYRTYGKTGIAVSAIGFGAMRFPDQNNPDLCAGLVKHAYDRGITYFDTAIGYGKSEELCGIAFKEMAKTRAEKPFYVSTKTFAADESSVRRDLETSLRRMNLDWIDFYHIWCVITMDGWRQRKAKGVLRAFEKMKEEGLIRHICVSTHLSGAEIACLLEEYPFDGILLGYSAMNFAYRQAGIEAAAKKGLGVVVMNPLGGGVIPNNPERFSFVKTRPDETVVEGALRFLLNDSRISVVLVGASTASHIDEAVSAADGFCPLTEEQARRIAGGVSGAFNEMCTSCSYCDNCPEGVPVPKLMDAWNIYLLTGRASDMVSRLKWHWSLLDDAPWDRCTGCAQCERACTQKLPIIQRIRALKAEVEKSATGHT